MSLQPAPAVPALTAGEATPPRPRAVYSWLARWGFRSLLLALILFNAYWYVRDFRPLAKPETRAEWMKQERYEELQADLLEDLRRSPHNGDARFDLARVIGARDDHLGCARQLHQIPFWWPKKVMALQYEGLYFLRANRAKDAEAAFKECLASGRAQHLLDRVRGVVYDALLEIYIHEERIAEASTIFWTIYDRSGPEDRLDVMIKRMRAELERIRPEQALPQLRRFVEADPEDWEALRALGRAEQALDNTREARVHLRTCLKQWPLDPRVWIDWMTMLHKQGDSFGLAEAADRAPVDTSQWMFQGQPKERSSVFVEVSNEYLAEIWKYKGIVRERAADIPGAALAYRRAIALNPFQENYFHRLSRVEYRLGHREEGNRLHAINLELRDARKEVIQANMDVILALREPGPTVPPLATSIQILSKQCATLGWKREADAWTKLIPKAETAVGGRRPGGEGVGPRDGMRAAEDRLVAARP